MTRLEDLLMQSAKAAPDAVAITERDASPVLYKDLAEAAVHVADRLKALGVGPGDRVGLMTSKSAQSIAAIFGILRAGAAYVPVDVSAPLERCATIFSDCSVKAVIAEPSVLDDLVFALGQARHPLGAAGPLQDHVVLAAADPCPSADPDLAYILYTSGSTGRPKGVQHTHASALAFVDWCSDAFSPGPDDLFSSHAPLHFDLSILDIFVPVKHGASVRLIGSDEGKQPAALTELIEAEGITHWYSTPTILRLMVEMGDLPARNHSALRRVCFAGEVFPTKHLKRLASHWSHVRFFNLYGPTETNVCTAHRLEDPCSMDDSAAIPIGLPVSGDIGRVVDPDGRLVPPGNEGELLIAGGSVMTGYWGLPERDAQVFSDAEGKRWYATGDVVIEQSDGSYIYRGRRDRMVKRRGYRVELGEIEAAMVGHETISEVAAVSVEPEPGAVSIVLFHDWQSDGKPSLLALKRFANAHLPAYMIPDKFHRLDALPLTSTDKINYQALKEISCGFFTE